MVIRARISGLPPLPLALTDNQGRPFLKPPLALRTLVVSAT